MSELLYHHPLLDSEQQENLSPCYLYHGLFGTGMTLRSVAKMIQHLLSPVLVDLPNHGDSPHVSPGGFVATEALIDRSIDSDCARRGLPADCPVHLLGHSLGAKYAMLYALRYPERVQSLVLLDIAPMEYPPINRRYITLYQDIARSEFSNRKDAVQMLREHVLDEAMTLFLAKNLRMSDERVVLSLNVEELARSYDELRSFPAAEYEGKTYAGPVLVLRAEDTEYFPENAERSVARYFPRYELSTIPHTTHILHIDNPEGVSEHLCTFYENVLH